MDSFSFLKHWRRGDDGATLFTKERTPDSFSSDTTTTTIVTAVTDSNEQEQDDDGSFFDLEFALPEDDSDTDVVAMEKSVEAKASGEKITESLCIENQGEEEIVVNLSSDNNEGAESNLKEDLCTMESSETDTKFHASAVLKSATKFGVLMFKLKKCKSNVNEKSSKLEVGEEKAHREKNSHPEQKQQHKFFAVKLKAEEVPLLSLFTRDFSSKGENKRNNVHVENVDSNQCSSPDRKIGKDVMNKYLKKVKPLYIRVSKRYGDKLGFSVDLPEEVKSQAEKSVSPKAGGETAAVVSPGVEQSNVKSVKQDLQAGLRLVYKQLGKSQSAAVAAVPAASSRRDDSLMQQEDGIQSAILHCKRSFNASRDVEASMIHLHG